MLKKVERIGKEVACPNCSTGLKYSWLSGLNAKLITFYSNCGAAILVSEELRKLIEGKDEIETVINNFLQSMLNDRAKSSLYNFSLKNELRCPNCNIALTARENKSNEEILNSRAIYLDGMKYINDEGQFVIKILVNEDLSNNAVS